MSETARRRDWLRLWEIKRLYFGFQWPMQWGYFSTWYDGPQRVLHAGIFFVGLKP